VVFATHLIKPPAAPFGGKQRGAYKGRKETLTTERAAELVQRAGNGILNVVLARDYGISRETVYQYLRQATLK
jgi:DNA-binding CsgD family transcriptional regulator